MKFNDHYEIHCVADNVIMLSYLEPDGDGGIIHNIVWPDDFGMLDYKFEYRDYDRAMEEFKKLDEGLPSGAQKLFEQHILTLLIKEN